MEDVVSSKNVKKMLTKKATRKKTNHFQKAGDQLAPSHPVIKLPGIAMICPDRSGKAIVQPSMVE